MPKQPTPLMPSALRSLITLGENLRLARLRRRLQAKQVAERAGISVVTLRAIERGAPTVTMGAYTSVLHVLGLEQDISQLAQADPLGRRLQDAGISNRMAPRRMRSLKNSSLVKD